MNDHNNQIQNRVSSNELAADTNTFLSYLNGYGLPTDNIIASTEERAVIGKNLPTLLETIPTELRKDARYLSKFIGATAIGLFDAGLNFIWNEVVLTLRNKASIYGIQLFYDAAVSGKNRESYTDESDLDGIKDIVLLDTCKKLELISDIVHKKVHHILTMRNDVAASHPNVENIGGYELLGWLQTCVKDIIQDQPSESSIRIKSIVDNIKSRTDALDTNSIARFAEQLKHLSLPHVHNLLITLFGVFVNQDTAQMLRANIAKIAPSIWNFSTDQVRHRIGVMVDGYQTNFQKNKYDRAVEFLGLVQGKMYESLPARIIALGNLAEQLEEAHTGHDNYWNEPPIMKEILQYIRQSQDIPSEIATDLIRAVLRCRIGRGLPYRNGVSPHGLPLYDQFLRTLDDIMIVKAIILLYEPEINAKIQNSICQQNLKAVLEVFYSITVSDRLKEILLYLITNIKEVYATNHRKEFRQLSSPFINWG